MNNNDIVIMKMEEYREKLLKEDIEEHLLKAEDDIRNGRVRAARDVFKEWKEKYGILYNWKTDMEISEENSSWNSKNHLDKAKSDC